jgi:hypothetical protein
MNKFKALFTGLTIVTLLLSAATSADALSIRVKSGATDVTITDGPLPDLLAVSGGVVFAGSVDTFLVTVVTGLSDPLLGSTTSPLMQLNVIAQTFAAGNHVLEVWLTDDGFGPSNPGVLATLDATVLVNSSVLYTSKQGSVEFDESAPFPLTSLFANSTAGLPISDHGVLAPGFPYSLTQKLVITHSGPASSNITATLAVPDGGLALSLLGFALVGIEGLRRRYANRS